MARRNSQIRPEYAAIDWLMTQPDAGRVGITGFCCGGGVANAAAVAYPELGGAVPFYGRQADAADVPKIKAPLLIHYGALDDRVNAGWPDFETALKAAGTRYEAFIYAGANHGFHNDSTPRYDKAAADLAWERTVAFFKANLVLDVRVGAHPLFTNCLQIACACHPAARHHSCKYGKKMYITIYITGYMP